MQLLVGLIAAAGAATPLAMQAEKTPLQPQGKWGVDYGETSCLATRTFRDATAPLTFIMRPSLNNTTVRLALLSEGGYIAPRHVPVTVADVKTTGLRFSPPGSRRRVTWIDISRTDFDRVLKNPSLRIIGERLDVDLSLAGVQSVLKALDTCHKDLRVYWNADEAGQARIATRSKPLVPPMRFVGSDDFPTQAVQEGKGGRTGVSLLIDEKGELKDCLVETHSGIATIDAQTCAMIQKRGKFAAALDAAGKPMKSYLTYRFNWKTS